MPGGGGYWLDCQSDLMESYTTRFVIPLVPIAQAPRPSAARLNPSFDIAGQRYSLLTQFAGSIPGAEIGSAAGSLAGERYAILNAIDVLIGGV
jgi:toxin CcdB